MEIYDFRKRRKQDGSGIRSLGIDIGTNSIGWCLVGPDGVEDIGSFVYHDGRDPKSGASLAVDRRDARSARRRRDRFLLREKDLMTLLVAHGLMPEDPAARKQLETYDPYDLRERGIDERLEPYEFGRALFHLHKRRGFKSNRKAQAKDDDPGKIRAATDRTAKAIEASGVRTLGEFLAARRCKKAPVRARMTGVGKQADYVFYPTRAMAEAEFDLLWNKQEDVHPGLKASGARTEIHNAMFRQRPVSKGRVGKCLLEPKEERAPVALPDAQRFRIYQELANLRIRLPDFRERRLTVEERDLLADRLLRHTSEKLTFKQAAKLLGIVRPDAFNLAGEARDYLWADRTATALAKKDRFGKPWFDLAAERQAEIVGRLLADEDPDVLKAWLRGECGLSQAAADSVADARLPDGYARLGPTALGKVTRALAEEVESDYIDPETGEIRSAPIHYAEAVRRAGYDRHTRSVGDGAAPRLPYYGAVLEGRVIPPRDAPSPGATDEARFGRLPNPTVHIGLNGLRKVVNLLVARHGKPDRIVVELWRELKQNREQKIETQKQQAQNRKRNEALKEKLRDIDGANSESGADLTLMKLWEELDPGDVANRRCPYSGERITPVMLFSNEVQVDHILPFSRTLDDSLSNRTVCTREANRRKRNRSPHEAFESETGGYAYDAILTRAKRLPKNKSWRFTSDAMDRFADNEGWLARQENDTKYLSRLTREYLTHICADVSVIPGKMTGMLRGKWGLNAILDTANNPAGPTPKDRTDHRHHAVDAFVIALTDRAMLQRVAAAAEDAHLRDRLIEDMPEPWPGFRNELRARVNRIVVAHRLDHGIGGALHAATAYGIVADPAKEDGFNLVARKPFAGLNRNEIGRIRDRDLRDAVASFVDGRLGDGQDIAAALADFASDGPAKWRGIRHVRLLVKQAKPIDVEHGLGAPGARNAGAPHRKAYIPGDNHHVDIFERPDGKWDFEGVTLFAANQPGHAPDWPRRHPDARLVMRLHKGDALMLDHRGKREAMRVVSLELSDPNRRLKLAAHHEAGNLKKRHKDPGDSFRWLFASISKLPDLNARAVRIDPLGRVHDRPPPDPDESDA